MGVCSWKLRRIFLGDEEEGRKDEGLTVQEKAENYHFRMVSI